MKLREFNFNSLLFSFDQRYPELKKIKYGNQ